MMRLSETFDTLSSKISQLMITKTVVDRNAVAKLLDDLIGLNYHVSLVKSPTKAVLLVNQFCTSVHPEDELLVSKCSQFTVKLLTTGQNVIIEGRTLTIAIDWCLQAIKSQTVKLASIRALEALTRNNVHNIAPTLLDAVWKEVEFLIQMASEQITEDTLLAAVKCLEALTVVPNDSNIPSYLYDHLGRCAHVFSLLLTKTDHPKDSIVFNKMLETCLIGLQNIIIIHRDYLKSEFSLILGLIKSYIVYNIDGIDFLPPRKLIAQTLNMPETGSIMKERNGGKVTRQRKQRQNRKKDHKSQEPNSLFDFRQTRYSPSRSWWDYNSDGTSSQLSSTLHHVTTSDSEYSDSEGGTRVKLLYSYSKVRQAALNFFAEAIKFSEKTTMFTYWLHFFPDNLTSGKHSLASCFLRDKSPKSKMCALNVLVLMLTMAKPFLCQAEFREKSMSSFTPFSVMLGLTLVELHRSLCLSLNHQFSAPILAQTLKCLAALVQATPYHKMPKGLVTKIVRNVKHFTVHRDASVQVTALIVIGCLLALDPPVAETEQAMIKIPKDTTTREREDTSIQHEHTSENFDYAQFSSEDEEDAEEAGHNQTAPWLLQICLANLGIDLENFVGKKEVPAPVKLESLQILLVMSRNYFESLMWPLLTHITKALVNGMSDPNPDTVLHAGRAVDFLGEAMTKSALAAEQASLCLNFWQTLLSGPLVSMIQNDHHSTLRSIGCDCIGIIGPHFFQQLPKDKQILCVTLLFGRVQDEENLIRGSAVRALAICVGYPPLCADAGFVADTAEAVLRVLNNENLNTRVKASWALGSLSDSLVIGAQTIEDPDEALPEQMLLRLIEAAVMTTRDNERVRMNSVRALGNLLQLLDDGMLSNYKFQTVLLEALNALEKNSTTDTNMKVRWNACYALATALKNPCIFTVLQPNGWHLSAFPKLADVVMNFKNFKVRIHATAALSAPSKREHYDKCFISIWSAMLHSLESAQNVDVLSEYKHRDQLVEQICLCLSHLTCLLTKDDLPQLERFLVPYLDLLKTHMQRTIERLVPEKSTKLFSAAVHLNNLETLLRDINSSEKIVIDSLKAVFVTH
ncbi:HEAT repeat-containing protein 6 isoform X1 [Euwallacea fornicatus]|uniref:HEAT repeat-containing protein 6 isoform X1 n=1 Tax=Euwallacea fornicatus TaxID=995702 RepID=UPI00338EAAA0